MSVTSDKNVFSSLPQLVQVIQGKILNANESQIKPRKQPTTDALGRHLFHLKNS